jgi:hypothetical protein
MAHRNALGVMSPLPRFSVVPYFIDPAQNIGTPGSKWHLNHQQAHNDALENLPSYFGASTVGLPSGGILRDYNLDDPRQRAWWTFQNWQEHYVGGDAILPNVQPQPPAIGRWTYPFW